MKGIRVDKQLTSLTDLLAIVPSMISKISQNELPDQHYLKVWKFYEEHNDPETVRVTALPLFEKIEFKRNEGYLGAVFYQDAYQESFLPEAFEHVEGLENLTPRGVHNEFSVNKGNKIGFTLFVANGKHSGALVKAILLTRAFELDSFFQSYPAVLTAVYSGIYVKSKKITKSDTVLLPVSSKKPETQSFLAWLVPKKNQPNLPFFTKNFFTQSPGKLFMNPFGVTQHKPKISSLSLKNVQTKYQEKESILEITNISELNELEIRDTTINELKLEYYTEKISELIPGLYVSGDAVARNKDLLMTTGVTHIVNCAGNVCENYFPDDFSYQKFYIKDSSNYNIEGLFYPIYTYIDNAIKEGGKVLFHCMQGVSRSVALCIGYMIFKSDATYESALDQCKNIRAICSPNIGFQVQLIWWHKRLYENYQSLPINPRIFLISSHDPDQLNNITAKLLLSSTENFNLDSRTIFLIHTEIQFYIWIGGKVGKNYDKYLDVAKQHASYLEKFENCQEFCCVFEGDENDDFWAMWENKVIVAENPIWEQILGEYKEIEKSENYEEVFEESSSGDEIGVKSSSEIDVELKNMEKLERVKKGPRTFVRSIEGEKLVVDRSEKGLKKKESDISDSEEIKKGPSYDRKSSGESLKKSEKDLVSEGSMRKSEKRLTSEDKIKKSEKNLGSDGSIAKIEKILKSEDSMKKSEKSLKSEDSSKSSEKGLTSKPSIKSSGKSLEIEKSLSKTSEEMKKSTKSIHSEESKSDKSKSSKIEEITEKTSEIKSKSRKTDSKEKLSDKKNTESISETSKGLNKSMEGVIKSQSENNSNSDSEFEHIGPMIYINNEDNFENGSKIDETQSKYEKVSIKPDGFYSKDSYSKQESNKDYIDKSVRENSAESVKESENAEKNNRFKMFIYPELEGIGIFDEEELVDERLVCICMKKKCIVWRGAGLRIDLQACKEYANEICKIFYGDLEIEIVWEQSGEESESFLDLFG